MPVPKRKTSPSRKRQRRAHHALEPSPHVRPCPQCNEPTRMHAVCAACGYYRGKEVIEIPIE